MISLVPSTLLTLAPGLPFGHQTEPTTSVWDTLKGLFDYREEQTTPSPSVQLIRLRSGNLLTIRTLPLSKSRTFIECNLYSKTTLHRTRTRNEINQLKSALQVRLTNLESLQRKLTSGTAELASGEQTTFLYTLQVWLMMPQRH